MSLVAVLASLTEVTASTVCSIVRTSCPPAQPELTRVTVEVRMRVVLLLCIAIFPVSGWSQIDGPRPYKPLHADLFRRARSSELIAIVTVVEGRGVGTRISTEELMRLGDIDKAYGGSLFSLQVEDVLFAKTDFVVNASNARPKPDKVLVFKDRAQSFDWAYYEPGQRYLIFLTPHREQNDLATKYKLEAGTAYYEAFEGERGLISLTGEGPPEVAKIKQFCLALRPADPNAKIRRLTRLLGSGEEPELEQAAVQAIEFFQREMSRGRQ